MRLASASTSAASASRCFATSLTYFTYRLLLPEVTSPPKIEPFQPLAIPGLSDIPVVGQALFNQTPLTYLAFLTVALTAWVLYRTPLGLALRAAGENPSAVEARAPASPPSAWARSWPAAR